MRDIAVWATVWIVCSVLAIDVLHLEGLWLMVSGVGASLLAAFVVSFVQVWTGE